MIIDVFSIFLFLLIMAMAGAAQFYVKSSFDRYGRVPGRSGLTGAQAAHLMLQKAGITNVRIERSQGGDLSDHYDPRDRVIRLSDPVYGRTSLSALGVACHEAGHAIQHARHYAPLVLRNGIVPLTNASNMFSQVFIMIGFFALAAGLGSLGTFFGLIGVLMLFVVFLFQLVNLIPEFDASYRAKQQLVALGIVDKRTELGGVNTVLNAAALTYVAATIGALLTLAYYAMLFLGNRREE
ncbi:MAG: zinc metallopeptidase [Candidatus Sumerlaeia bacterium]|nr:zinc metallopeptidase [Candidatus Sumerlaeia bacterium]